MTGQSFIIVASLAASTGIPPDLVKTAIAFILTLISSPIFRFITNRNLKNVVNIIFGSLLLIFMIEEWSLFILAGMIIPFLIMKISKTPFLVGCVISFSLLAYVHSYRLFQDDDEWKVDISVYVMLLVAKLTYYGKYIQKKESKFNFLDYLGYHLFFPSIIVGPIFSFEIYETFLINKHNATFQNIKWLKALQPLAKSLIFLVILLNTMQHFPPTWVLTNQFYLSLNGPLKLLSLFVIGFIYRVKYYFAWYFGQATTNLSGLSYGESGEYDGVLAISFKFQTEGNSRIRTQYWNISMQEWLKVVVFEGLSGFGGTVAFFGTFMISAFWHGIYLSYFYGFLLWGILLHVTKWAYKWSFAFPQKITDNFLLKGATYIVSTIFLDYIGMFIVNIKWQNGVAFHALFYHVPTIILFLLLAASFLIKPPKNSAYKQKQN